MSYDPATTGRIALNASWPIYSDDPKQIAPTVPVDEVARCFDPLVEGLSEGNMTRLILLLKTTQRNNQELILADSMFQEMPLEQVAFVRRLITHLVEEPHQQALVQSTPLSHPEPGELPQFPILDFTQSFDDSAYRKVTYTPQASTCYESFFTHSEACAGRSRELKVVATAAPLVPDVSHFVPLYGWHTEDSLNSDGKYVSHRKGFALRIFLRRPWYSSGQGEQLALVFPLQWPPAPQLRSFVSQWGFDPLWSRPSVAATAWARLKATDVGEARDYTGFATAIIRQPLPESAAKVMSNDAEQIEIAAHDVRYSPHRGLWYCDIVFNKDCEKLPSPFVRLAIARYQPDAIPGAQLSDIVQLELIPLQNSRTATMHRQGSTISLTVSGVFPDDDPGEGKAFDGLEVQLIVFPPDDRNVEITNVLGGGRANLIDPEDEDLKLSIKFKRIHTDEQRSTWRAVFDLPRNNVPGSRRRLRVVEKQKFVQTTDEPNNDAISYGDTLPVDI
jgi:hypothetical protein